MAVMEREVERPEQPTTEAVLANLHARDNDKLNALLAAILRGRP